MSIIKPFSPALHNSNSNSITTFLPLLLIIFAIIPSCSGYSTVMQMSITTTSASVTNFNQDMSACSCDTSTACDVFCCCDAACEASLVSKWTTNGWCAQAGAQIEKMCSNIGKKGFSSFQDIACIMYSNRGAIGSYYPTPNSNNFVDPNTKKFSVYLTNAQGIPQYTLPSTSTYQSQSPIRIKINSATTEPLLIYSSSMWGQCRLSYVPIQQQSTTTSCMYSITDAQSCANANKIIGSTVQFCELYGCSTAVGNNSIGVSAPSYDNVTGLCSGVVDRVVVDVVIAYSNQEYKIVSGSLSVSTSNVRAQVMITTSISIRSQGTSNSGNPGYIYGKPVRYSSGGIYSIANPSDKSCLTTPANTSSSLNLLFGVNQTFNCLTSTSTACSTSLYIDNLVTASSFKVQKYAASSTQAADTIGLATVACTTQSYTMTVLYSYSGWIMDPQYYVLSSVITGDETNANSNQMSMKQLRVRWVKVQPNAVSTPPTNYFYLYFQKLWTPLRSKFYSLTNYHPSLTIVIAVTTMLGLIASY